MVSENSQQFHRLIHNVGGRGEYEKLRMSGGEDVRACLTYDYQSSNQKITKSANRLCLGQKMTILLL